MSLGSRLKEYIDYQRITVKEFERRNNFSNGLIGRVVGKNKDMSTKQLRTIGENHPDLNMNWLINGEEEMLKEDEINLEEDINKKLSADIEFYKDMVKTLQNAVDALTKKKVK